MKKNELIDQLGLQPGHFQWENLEAPILEPGLYNTLGMRLYELYQKYSVEPKDQREIENICFVLLSFVLRREETESKTRRRWVRWIRN